MAMMTLLYALLIFVAGAALGAFFARLGNKDLTQQKELKKDLDKSRYELEQYRQELVDHFARSAELLDNVAKDYGKLYEHMAKTSTELMPNLPAQDNPFAHRISTLSAVKEKEMETEEDDTTQNPPRDYAHGATGLFSGQTEPEKKADNAQSKTEENKVAS